MSEILSLLILVLGLLRPSVGIAILVIFQESGCDPQLWFGNVETIVYKSTAKIHNGRSSYEVNRHHVHDVFNNRMNKHKLEYNKN